MPPANLSRRSTAGAFLAGAVGAVTPDPKVAASTAATAAQTTALAVEPVVAPRSDLLAADVPTPTAAPRAAAVDAAYRPRAAVPGPAPVRSSGTRTTVAARVAAATATPTTPTSAAHALHLARRASFGATPELVAEIRAKGATTWVDAQLSPGTVPDTAMDALAASTWPLLDLPIWGVHDTYHPDSTGDLGRAAVEATVARALWSRRQLLEVMVEFWTNHLVVTAPWGESWDSVHRYQADVIRTFALGRYADMLVASAKHPAMLGQLDNASSTKRAPNENYGREVLELHTVGIDGGYLESDIRRSALALTGMSVDRESGEYYYRQIRHHTGALSILGWSHANTSAYGEGVGEAYLTHLARHPRTARRLATKLAVRFVSDTPPSALVDRLAQVYLDHDTRIAPVVRALLTSAEFAASAGQKTKRPLEDITSTARILGVTPGSDTKGWLSDLVWYARVAGQAPMAWPAPNGYPDVAAAWAGTGATLARWNWHMAQGWMAGDSAAEVTYPAFRSLLPATVPATYGALVDALATRLLFAPLPTAKRDAVCAFLDKTAVTAVKSTDAVLGWRLPYVVALVLDTPEFATR